MVATTPELEGIFRANRTLDSAIQDCMQHYEHPVRQRVKIRLGLVFLLPSKRRELEQRITSLAMERGAIPAAGDNVVGGVYVGSWTDLLDWIIENWSSILEIILSIISLF